MPRQPTVTVIGRRHYLVESRSRKGVEHVVDAEPNEYSDSWACSCEHNRFRFLECFHIRRAKALEAAHHHLTHEQIAKTTPPTDRTTLHPPRKYILAGAIPRRRADPPAKHRHG